MNNWTIDIECNELFGYPRNAPQFSLGQQIQETDDQLIAIVMGIHYYPLFRVWIYRLLPIAEKNQSHLSFKISNEIERDERSLKELSWEELARLDRFKLSLVSMIRRKKTRDSPLENKKINFNNGQRNLPRSPRFSRLLRFW